MFVKINLLILISLLLFPFLLYSQESGKNVEKIILRHADSLLGTRSPGMQVETYSGNVVFVQGDVTVKTNTAKHFQSRNYLELRGNVRIYQDDMVLRAPEIDYNGNSGIAKARKGVEIVDRETQLTASEGVYSTKTHIAEFRKEVIIDDDSSTIFAEEIIHNRDTKVSRAYGDVVVQGKHTNSLLNSDTVIYKPNDDYTLATGNPLLYQIDTVRRENETVLDTLSIISNIMEAYRGDTVETYVFDKNVEITRDEVAARADSATYDKRKGIMRLFKSPVVWYDSTQLFAESTVVYIKDNKLNRIHAKGKAFSGSRDTLNARRIDQLSGAEIIMDFAADTVSGIVSSGNAKSLYFLESEETADGAARNGADTILIEFSGGEPEKIRWLGAIEGEYYPEKFVAGTEKNLYLPDFKWEESKPVKILIENRKNSKPVKSGEKEKSPNETGNSEGKKEKIKLNDKEE